MRFRNSVRTEAGKVARRYDQTALGTIEVVRDGGRTLDVAFDGFGAGTIQVGCVAHVTPRVGHRVIMLGLAGGQSWFVVGTVR